jgi:hypothetical protein
MRDYILQRCEELQKQYKEPHYSMKSKALVRFWKRVEKTEGCWLWKGAKSAPDYYGRVVVRGKIIMVHRLSYALAYGTIPKGMFVLHTCKNPVCVNPQHLYLGTVENNRPFGDRELRQAEKRKILEGVL